MKRDKTSAMKFQAARIHYLSDVSAALTVVGYISSHMNI